MLYTEWNSFLFEDGPPRLYKASHCCTLYCLYQHIVILLNTGFSLFDDICPAIITSYRSALCYITLAGNFSKTSFLPPLWCELPRLRGNVGCSGHPLFISRSTHSWEPELLAYHKAFLPSWSTTFTSAFCYNNNVNHVNILLHLTKVSVLYNDIWK